jgi:hypothetical protein
MIIVPEWKERSFLEMHEEIPETSLLYLAILIFSWIGFYTQRALKHAAKPGECSQVLNLEADKEPGIQSFDSTPDSGAV